MIVEDENVFEVALMIMASPDNHSASQMDSRAT